jgi:hypothetical protein
MHPHGAVADSLASTRAVLAAGLLRPCIPEAWSEGPQTASSFSGSSNSMGSTKARLARSVTESAQRTTRLRAGRGPTRTPARLGFSEARSTATTWVCPLPASTRAPGSGSKNALMAPSFGPPEKGLFAGEKWLGVRDPRPLGQQWTRLPPTGASTATTGACPFAHHSAPLAAKGVPARRVRDRHRGPRRGPQQGADLQGNSRGSGGPCPLGAAMDSPAFLPAYREKYCHNGGLAFAHHHGVGLPGVHDGDHGPFRRPP